MENNGNPAISKSLCGFLSCLKSEKRRVVEMTKKQTDGSLGSNTQTNHKDGFHLFKKPPQRTVRKENSGITFI